MRAPGPLGPVVVRGRELRLRTPRLSDGPAWTAQRLACRDQLEPWWPEDGDWAVQQGPMAWVEHCTQQRRAARRGLARPAVLLQDGVLVGELGIAAVDPGTGTGEYSAWVNTAQVGSGVVRVAAALTALAAFTGPRPLERLVAPISTGNPVANAAARAAGFVDNGVLTAYRGTTAGRADHRIWTLHPDDATLTRLRGLVTALTAA